ncbi:MAG: type II and III secretion system protein family protein [Proteobacteria bacterium]|nr:type II and III secretion system protein family protein [Pseudomonadota bacterium]
MGVAPWRRLPVRDGPPFLVKHLMSNIRRTAVNRQDLGRQDQDQKVPGHRIAPGRTIACWKILREIALAGTMTLIGVLYLGTIDAHAAPRRADEARLSGTSNVSVVVGKSQDVRTSAGFVNISVGDPEIADVNPLTDHSLSILGKKIGTTRVTIYDEQKRLVGIYDVEVTYDVSRLVNELRRRFPHSRLHASAVNGRIMLGGEVPDATTLDQAVTIARQFGPDIINAVSVMSPQQVMLEVRFIEISRTAGRELGFQWNRFGEHSVANIGSRQPASNLPITAPTSSGQIPAGEVAAGVLSGGSPFGFMLARMVANGVTTDVMINALEQKGVARSLAEPNLVALSGDTASFLAGGEYPIPVAGSLGQVTVDYKKYGVGLAFTPTVLSHGLINMKIEPEVSAIDTTHTVSVAYGVSVPALTVRRASTTIELRDGQSFVIGGLLQNNGQNQLEQLPWLGTVPVLGALFSSKSYQRNETDLAIIVTPHIVRPARPGDLIKAPTDDARPPNDVDYFLMGKTELPNGKKPRRGTTLAASDAQVAAAAGAPSGHMLDMPKWISNAAVQ